MWLLTSKLILCGLDLLHYQETLVWGEMKWMGRLTDDQMPADGRIAYLGQPLPTWLDLESRGDEPAK